MVYNGTALARRLPRSAAGLPAGQSSRFDQCQLLRGWWPDRDATLLAVGQRARDDGRSADRLHLHRPEVGRQCGIAVLWGAVLRCRAGPVRAGGHHRAESGQPAELEDSILLHTQT